MRSTRHAPRDAPGGGAGRRRGNPPRRAFASLLPIAGVAGALGSAAVSCGFQLGDRECTDRIGDAACGDWGRLYFAEATDDPEVVAGPPRPVATGARYALRVGVEEFGVQGMDSGWVLQPRLLASAYAREDLFVVEEVGELVGLWAVEPGTETLFVGTEESTRDRIQLVAVDPVEAELSIAGHSGQSEGGPLDAALGGQSDVGLLPGAWIELDVALFDAAGRPLAGYGVADWRAAPGLTLELRSRFSDRVRITSTGELGGLSRVEGAEDLQLVVELVGLGELSELRPSLVEAFGTGATLDHDGLEMLLERPVRVAFTPYAASGRPVIAAETTTFEVAVLEGEGVISVRDEPGVGRVEIEPLGAGDARIAVALGGREAELVVTVR